MASSPARGYSFSRSSPVFTNPPSGSAAGKATSAMMQRLNQPVLSFQDHYASLPEATPFTDLPQSAYDPFAGTGFDLNAQMQSYREPAGLEALNNLRNQYQQGGGMGLPSGKLASLFQTAQQLGRGFGERNAQGLLREVLGPSQQHAATMRALQSQIDENRSNQQLGRAGIATNLRNIDVSGTAGIASSLASLLRQGQRSYSESGFTGPTV